jgi:hypothetical protein
MFTDMLGPAIPDCHNLALLPVPRPNGCYGLVFMADRSPCGLRQAQDRAADDRRERGRERQKKGHRLGSGARKRLRHSFEAPDQIDVGEKFKDRGALECEAGNIDRLAANLA